MDSITAFNLETWAGDNADELTIDEVEMFERAAAVIRRVDGGR